MWEVIVLFCSLFDDLWKTKMGKQKAALRATDSIANAVAYPWNKQDNSEQTFPPSFQMEGGKG